MPKETLKLTHKPLHCPVCSERFMNMFGQPLPNHAQIRCKTTRGDEMDIGICENCIEGGVSLEMVSAVLEGIKDYWVYDIDQSKILKADEKASRKAQHRSHQITTLTTIMRTGKEAEKKIKRNEKFEGFGETLIEPKKGNKK